MSQAKQVTEPTSKPRRPLHNVFEEQITVHPLVPLARAASILRTDPILLKERLASGQIKGEQRSDSDPNGQKNSWYIYSSEFNRLLNDQLARYENRISTEGLDQLFDAKTGTHKNTEKKVSDTTAKTTSEEEEKEVEREDVVADVDVQMGIAGDEADVIHIEFSQQSKHHEHDSESAMQLIGELASKLESATYRNGYLEALLEAQAEQIRLLPDLQDQASRTALLEAELEQLRQQANSKKSWFGHLTGWFKANS